MDWAAFYGTLGAFALIFSFVALRADSARWTGGSFALAALFLAIAAGLSA